MELLVVADVDPLKATAVAATVSGPGATSGRASFETAARSGRASFAPGGMRCEAVGLDASDADAIVEVAKRFGVDAIVNACDPRFNPPIFEATFQVGVTYLDMAMNLSKPHPEKPYELIGETLGVAQDAMHEQWRAKGQLALVGMGVEPGLSDVFEIGRAHV